MNHLSIEHLIASLHLKSDRHFKSVKQTTNYVSIYQICSYILFNLLKRPTYLS